MSKENVPLSRMGHAIQPRPTKHQSFEVTVATETALISPSANQKIVVVGLTYSNAGSVDTEMYLRRGSEASIHSFEVAMSPLSNKSWNLFGMEHELSWGEVLYAKQSAGGSNKVFFNVAYILVGEE